MGPTEPFISPSNRLNHMVLEDFPNVTGANQSNSDTSKGNAAVFVLFGCYVVLAS